MARQRKPRLPRVVKRPQKLEGGPMHGHPLWLTSGGTLIFTLHGQSGRYDRDGIWEGHMRPG